jgi:hypothetical protein
MKGGRQEFWIDFGASGNSVEFCRSGWSQPEPRHTWTIGRESALALPRPAEPGAYKLVLELGPFVWKDRLTSQPLAVVVNGNQVGAFDLREIVQVECMIPWSLIEPQETILVTFVHPAAAKPSEVSGVADHREIAFAFERLHLCRVSNAGALETTVATSVPALAALPPDRLLMRFESLGENCEFGLVQRRCGAEPLGLLRFASAPLPKLLAALERRFEGLGEPDEIAVEVSPNRSEYLVIDRRYGLLYHPWILVGEAEPEQIRLREATRLPFLRRKMLDDLEEGHKIFVYHAMQRSHEADAERLFAAVRSYGPGALLWVELADDMHRAGTVEEAKSGLFKGYIDRFAPSKNAHDLSLECWVALCRSVYRIAASEELYGGGSRSA